jgi:uncharacterized protein (DUF885 family)
MSRTSARFEGLLDRYFWAELEAQPMWATFVGLKEGEGKLGRANAESVQRRHRRRLKALAELDGLNPRELSNEQQLDRLALRSLLLRECENHARRRHTLEPNALELVLNILLHELQRGDDEPARAARNLRSLLRQTPRFLAEGETLIDRPDPVWRRVMDQTAAGAESLFQAVETFLRRTGLSAQDAGRLSSARRACADYRNSVLERPLARPGSFAVGAWALQRRVRDELGLDYTLGEIEALAESEVARIGALLQRQCARFGGRRPPEQILAEARAHWEPGEDLVAAYRSETARMANAFRASRAVSFPEQETLVVKPVPDFMRHLFPTAAYSSPGAFERRQRGIFWVNDLSVTKTTQVEKRAERQQHFGLSLTCAHEAYPGHHLQFVTANRHPRKWRRLFAHAVFYEGWTLWCEQMLVDLGIDPSPWLQVQQLYDALWRCHRILIDLRLQTGRYSYDQAVRHLQKHLHFTRARAEADVNWYTAAPAVPMSYWLGRLENERLRQRLVVGRGWSLQKFNDWLLSFGTLPQAWVEKYGLD